MKQNLKRGISLLLTLVLFVGLLSGITLPAEAATVNYVYSGNYVYNWGTREVEATFLSPMAEDFYAEKSNRSYDYLSSLSGSSTESSVKNSALYKELQSIMSDAHTNETSYNDTRDLFKYTDCQNSGGKISSFYSGKAIGPSWDGGSTWNREHTWPNSKGDASGNGENDLMMLRPTSVSENSGRGNKAYGESSSYYDPNEQSGGTYDLRGDVARIMLYTYTRWGCTNTGSKYNPNGIFGTDGIIESKDVMLKWIEEDPVDTWEMGRNDACESILGTRNIFVDYPELAFVLWDEEIPSNMTTPSGEAKGGAVSYTITATSNNTSYGTVSVSGKTINAVPKTGYYVSGYTLISGSAQVTQNGNNFAVVPASNCTIRVNFAARTSFTTTFYEDGTKATTQSAYGGDSITLPSHSSAAPDGYSFVGWVTSQVESTENKPATIYFSGSSYIVNSAATFYALYSKFEGDGTSTGSDYTLFTDTIVEGDYVIYYKGKAMNTTLTSSRLQYVSVTPSNDTISEPAEEIVWHIAPNGNYFTLYNEASGTYAAGNGTKNKAALVTSVTDYARWTITVKDGTYEIINLGNKSDGVNANLRNNGTYGFATYSTSTGGALSLYKAGSGTTIYTTNVSPACTHENQVLENVKEATCTANGYTGDLYCDDCGELLKSGTVTTADHTFELVDGEVSCSGCGGVPEGDAFMDGVMYDTLDEALEAATAGHTITVLTHCEAAQGIYLDTGICLDLNGNEVNTDSVLSYGSIIDSSNGHGGLFAEELLMESCEQLVLWDEEAGVYRFFDYALVSLGTKTVSDGVRFGFALDLSNEYAYELLAAQGHGQMQVTVTMAVGSTTKTFAFSDALICQYAQLHQQYPHLKSAMMLNVTGLDALTAGQTLRVTPSITMTGTSDSVSGTAMTYTK